MRNVFCLASGVVTCCAPMATAQPLNLCDWEWKHVTASAAASEPAGAWNPATGKFMVYGGMLSGWSPETWEFDGQKWIRLDSNTPPQLASRSSQEFFPRASMAYDEHRQKMCLALVYPRLGDRPSDAEFYEWEGGTWKFKAVLPADFRLNSQDVRIHLVFDHEAQKLLLLNGKSNLYALSAFAATGWHFDGQAFTPIVFTPAAYWTLHHQIASDPTRDRTLLTSAFPHVSGRIRESLGGVLSPVSEFPISPAASFPSATSRDENCVWGMSSFYSPIHGGLVQTGGVRGTWPSSAANVLVRILASNTKTAVWNGASWQAISNDSPRVGGGIACFDPLLGRGLLFGGRSVLGENTTSAGGDGGAVFTNARVGDVWALNGNSWQQITCPPLGMTNHAAAAILDPSTNKLVVASSARNTELNANGYLQTEWDGQVWKKGADSLGGSNPYPASMPPASDLQFAWDPVGNRLIAVADMDHPTTPKVRTFAFNGTSWAQIGSENRAWMRWRIVTNSTTGKVLLVSNSGTKGVYQLGGADGNTWVLVTAQIPGNNSNSEFDLFFDEARGKVVAMQKVTGGGFHWLEEFDGAVWKPSPQGAVPVSFAATGGWVRSWNPLLRAVVTETYRNGREGDSQVDVTPLGFPTNSDHRLATWDGTAWKVINDGGAHPADAGYIWQDRMNGKWFSYGGTPRSDIWELVPITGDRFVRQPIDAVGYVGRSAGASLEFRGGIGPVSYSWRLNGIPVTASPTSNGTSVFGWSKPAITFSNLKAGTDATLDCVITIGCDTFTTQPVRLLATCLGDLNGDSFVDDADFVIFASCYDAYYTPDDKPLCRLNDTSQITDDRDFLVFVGAYDAGACPE